MVDLLGFSVNSAAWFFAGLVVGWNLLAQPVWVSNLYEKWFGDKETEE